MRRPYSEIIERLGWPDWWDDKSVPRYLEFHPDECANQRATEAAILLIQCASCRMTTQRATSTDKFELMREWRKSLRERIAGRTLDIGPPPNTGCCSNSDYQPAIVINVLQYWHRPGSHAEWIRDESIEGDYTPMDAHQSGR